jgi:hypothetical protein
MSRLKADKIKQALEKMKEANIKKLYVKFFTSDGGSKSLLVDERSTVSHVLRQLAEKHRITLNTDYAVVERYPDLFMGKGLFSFSQSSLCTFRLLDTYNLQTCPTCILRNNFLCDENCRTNLRRSGAFGREHSDVDARLVQQAMLRRTARQIRVHRRPAGLPRR